MDYHGGEIKEKIEYDFSVNINPLGMPEYVKDAIYESVRLADSPVTNHINSLCSYPDRHCSELRQKIACIENVDASEILCGNGASELIMAVCAYSAVSKAEGHIHALMAAPTFSGYERAVKAYGGEVDYYKDCDDLKSILKDGATPDLLFICNPNNPTGEAADGTVLSQIIEMAASKNILVVVDECFIDFTHEESLTGFINGHDKLIVLKAFTKFYAMAGIRLGYMCASDKLCEKIAGCLPEWNVSGLAQVAGCAAYESIDKVENWKQKTLDLVDKEREFLLHELAGMVVADSKANFLLCKCDDKDICSKLQDIGILVRDCGNFNGLDSSYFRICVSTHENNEKLINALKGLI